MAASLAVSPAPTPAPTACATCDADESTDAWFLATTTFSWSSASWVLSATQPVCTWEGHCLGDPCKIDDGCDRDWECQKGICQPCCSPAAESSQASSSGLDTSAKVGIGVAVPATVAMLAGVFFLLWRSRRKRRESHRRQAAADGLARPELHGSGIALTDVAKRAEMDADGPVKRAELPAKDEVAVEADSAHYHPVELEDTSASPQKHEYIRLPEPVRARAQEKTEQADEATGMYRQSLATGVLPSPSPTPTAVATPLPLPTSSPTPEWQETSPETGRLPTTSGQPSNFIISPEPSYASNLRESPVSTMDSARVSHSPGQRWPPPPSTPGLPAGMIDRFDEEDDEDEEHRSARRQLSRETPQAPYTQRSDQDLFMFGWTSPPESPITDERRPG